jgi:hypothetical protein
MLSHSIGERVSTEPAFAALVVHPDARRRRAGEVRAHDHLDLERLAVGALEHVRIGHRSEVALRDARELLEPERRKPREDLPFERNRSEHVIERADSIRRDDEPAPVTGAVVVTDLALVFLAERLKIRAVERGREPAPERRLVDHGRRISVPARGSQLAVPRFRGFQVSRSRARAEAPARPHALSLAGNLDT